MQQKVVTSEIFRDKKDGYAESLNQPFANSRIGKSIFPSMYSLSLFKKKKKKSQGVTIVVQRKQIQLVSMRMWVWSPASLRGSGIWCCRELWGSSQIRLESGVAVAVG